MKVLSLFLVINLVLVLAPSAFGNFALDPQRQEDPAFAKFFLNRADTWLRKNILDYQAPLTKEDRAAISRWLVSSRDLGSLRDGVFVPTYSFGFNVVKDQVTYGPFRFARANPNADEQAQYRAVLKSHGVQLPTQKRSSPSPILIGVGFTTDPKIIEALTWDQALIVTRYRDGLEISKTTIEAATTKTPYCPAVTLVAHVDRSQHQDIAPGSQSGAPIIRFIYRPTAFQDEPLSMAGRRLIYKISVGLNLIPGSIDYKDQLNYGVAYP